MVMKGRLVGLLLVVGFLLLGSESQANPYLARPGEKPVALRIATCAVSGGFNVIYRLIELDIPFLRQGHEGQRPRSPSILL